MSNCKQCTFSPCTAAQGATCCIDCYHFADCSGPCFKAIVLNEERENKMKVNTKKTEEKKENVVQSLKVTRAHQFDDGSISIDMEVNGVSIYNATLRDSKNGMFVSFPSRKAKDGKYYSYVYVAFTKDDIDNIISQVEEL